MDDVNAKYTFLISLPEPLGDETLCMINLQKITLQQASLGEIYQHVLIALEKLCNQRKFLLEINKIHSKLKDNCKRKNLHIKYYDKNCACPIERRNHFKKYSWKKRHYAGYKKRSLKKKNWKFLKESSLKEKLQRSILYADDQDILQKIAQKRRKQQGFLNRPRSM